MHVFPSGVLASERAAASGAGPIARPPSSGSCGVDGPLPGTRGSWHVPRQTSGVQELWQLYFRHCNQAGPLKEEEEAEGRGAINASCVSFETEVPGQIAICKEVCQVLLQGKISGLLNTGAEGS